MRAEMQLHARSYANPLPLRAAWWQLGSKRRVQGELHSHHARAPARTVFLGFCLSVCLCTFTHTGESKGQGPWLSSRPLEREEPRLSRAESEEKEIWEA